MSSLTVNIPELRNQWMRLYLNLMMLKSYHPKAKELLESMKMKCAEFNETAMEFFDAMEES